ncbi:MAG: plastocyanin/azurin family copper-binding protein [Roseovarius sp.]|nr:plastocyanin/azurin family copper-binding protein [Roseovarius sp.]
MKLYTLALLGGITTAMTACAPTDTAQMATGDGMSGTGTQSEMSASGGTMNSMTNADSSVSVVEMTSGLKFNPSELRVTAGDTVEFRNNSLFAHTVSTMPNTDAERATVQLPADAAPFDSGSVPAGGTYRMTFDTPGTYRYFCDPHHGSGMIGTIIVEAS